MADAEAPDEGIEAVGYPFVRGVQWHPEFLNSEDQSEILSKAFLKWRRDTEKPIHDFLTG